MTGWGAREPASSTSRFPQIATGRAARRFGGRAPLSPAQGAERPRAPAASAALGESDHCGGNGGSERALAVRTADVRIRRGAAGDAPSRLLAGARDTASRRGGLAQRQRLLAALAAHLRRRAIVAIVAHRLPRARGKAGPREPFAAGCTAPQRHSQGREQPQRLRRMVAGGSAGRLVDFSGGEPSPHTSALPPATA